MIENTDSWFQDTSCEDDEINHVGKLIQIKPTDTTVDYLSFSKVIIFGIDICNEGNLQLISDAQNTWKIENTAQLDARVPNDTPLYGNECGDHFYDYNLSFID